MGIFSEALDEHTHVAGVERTHKVSQKSPAHDISIEPEEQLFLCIFGHCSLPPRSLFGSWVRSFSVGKVEMEISGDLPDSFKPCE
jgi:hypothetical protein